MINYKKDIWAGNDFIDEELVDIETDSRFLIFQEFHDDIQQEDYHLKTLELLTDFIDEDASQNEVYFKSDNFNLKGSLINKNSITQIPKEIITTSTLTSDNIVKEIPADFNKIWFVGKIVRVNEK